MNPTGWWARLSSEDRGALGIMAVPSTALLGICAARGGGFDGLGTVIDAITAYGPVAGGVALAGAAWLTLVKVSGGGSARSRRIVVHHGGSGWIDGRRDLAARHEAGHIVVAQRVGCRVTGARIYPDGSGWTAYELPRTPLGLDHNPFGVVEDIAISVAGEVASGTQVGCTDDHRHRDRTLSHVGWLSRDSVRRRAYRFAGRVAGPGLLGGVNPKVARYERRLLRTGRL